MRIFNIEIGKRRVREQYTDKAGSFVSRWSRPPTLNTAEWLNMFSKSPRLAVVDRIASDTANIGGKLLRVEPDGTETEITSHPFLRFICWWARASCSSSGITMDGPWSYGLCRRTG